MDKERERVGKERREIARSNDIEGKTEMRGGERDIESERKREGRGDE